MRAAVKFVLKSKAERDSPSSLCEPTFHKPVQARSACLPDVITFSKTEDAPFPVKLGEFIRFYENAVQ